MTSQLFRLCSEPGCIPDPGGCLERSGEHSRHTPFLPRDPRALASPHRFPTSHHLRSHFLPRTARAKCPLRACHTQRGSVPPPRVQHATQIGGSRGLICQGGGRWIHSQVSLFTRSFALYPQTLTSCFDILVFPPITQQTRLSASWLHINVQHSSSTLSTGAPHEGTSVLSCMQAGLKPELGTS